MRPLVSVLRSLALLIPVLILRAVGSGIMQPQPTVTPSLIERLARRGGWVRVSHVATPATSNSTTIHADAAGSEDDMDAEVPYGSLDLVYDELCGKMALQVGRTRDMDTKVNFALGAAALLTAAVAALGRQLAGSDTSVPVRDITLSGWTVSSTSLADWLTVAALGCFALTVIFTFLSYYVRDFDESPNPDVLVDRYVDRPEAYTKIRLVTSRAKDFAANERILAGKARWLTVSMVFLIAEGLLLTAIGALQAYVV